MLIKKDIAEYLVFGSESLLKALEKINANKKRLVFVVRSSGGQLLGSFSDGDFRRWVTSSKELDLATEVNQVMNTSVVSQRVNESRENVEKTLQRC